MPAIIENERKVVVLQEGRFLRLVCKNGWEYVERSNCSGIVIIIAMTNDKKVILTEQYRVPVGKRVVEFPAGLVNDHNKKEKESLTTAAKRELLEETGYRAKRWVRLTHGPSASGSSADNITLFLAQGLRKVAAGGGDETEAITLHEISLSKVPVWLREKQKKSVLVDPKVYAGLYFLQKYNGND